MADLSFGGLLMLWLWIGYGSVALVVTAVVLVRLAMAGSRDRDVQKDPTWSEFVAYFAIAAGVFWPISAILWGVLQSRPRPARRPGVPARRA